MQFPLNFRLSPSHKSVTETDTAYMKKLQGSFSFAVKVVAAFLCREFQTNC